MVIPWLMAAKTVRSLANPPSWWLWVSMNPGARISPLPSTTFSPAAGWRAPTASIRSPRMRTEAGTPGAPVPSTTVAPWMRRDGEAGSSAASTFASRGTRNRAAAGAMRRQALVIGPILEEGDAICPPDVSGRVESIQKIWNASRVTLDRFRKFGRRSTSRGTGPENLERIQGHAGSIQKFWNAFHVT